jgi:1-aminocyclopropane-1-carboxylate deaminase/D-cysteine desulfhydrase-like pyridoxal-dependent ACC family enzyme
VTDSFRCIHKIAERIISFVITVRLPGTTTTTAGIFMKFGIQVFFENRQENLSFVKI